MSLHEEFQKLAIVAGRKNAGLRNGFLKASLEKVIVALVNKGRYLEATELLFGSKEERPLIDDGIGFLVFRYLQSGASPERLNEAAGAHCWNPKKETDGLVIMVYPGEWFVIKDPIASKIADAVNQLIR